MEGSFESIAAVDESIVRFPAALAFSSCRTRIKKTAIRTKESLKTPEHLAYSQHQLVGLS